MPPRYQTGLGAGQGGNEVRLGHTFGVAVSFSDKGVDERMAAGAKVAGGTLKIYAALQAVGLGPFDPEAGKLSSDHCFTRVEVADSTMVTIVSRICAGSSGNRSSI